jgi:pectate lyase
MRVTIHHNFFQATGRRHPEARFGKFDVYNNYLYDWQMLHHDGLAGNPAGDSFGVKCRDNCRMVLQNNVFARNEHFRNLGTNVQKASWCESGGVIEDRGGQWVPWGQHNDFNVGCAPVGSAFTFPGGHVRNVEPVGGDLATRVSSQSGPRPHGLEN